MAAASLSAIAAGTIHAQDAAGEIEVIEVNASALGVSADQSVSSVDVLPRAELLERFNGNIADTLEAQPGVSSTYFGPAAGRPVVRGLGAERVRVLIDGLDALDASTASPDHGVAADVLGARQVEVLRGPAAIAYGGGAIGGVVNILDGRIPVEQPENPLGGELYLGGTSVDEGFQGFGRVTASPFEGLVLQGEYQRREASAYDIPGFAETAALRDEHHDHDHDHEDDHDHDDHDHDHDEDHDEHEEEPAFGVAPDTDYFTETYGGAGSVVGEWGYVGFGVKRTESEYGLPGHAHEHGDEGHDHDHDDEDHDHDDDHDDHEHGEEEAARLDLRQTRVDLRGELNFDAFFNRVRWSLAHSDYLHAELEEGEIGTIFDKEGFEARIEARHDHGGVRQGAWGVQALAQDFVGSGAEAYIEPVVTQDYGVFATERWDWEDWGIEGGLRVETRKLNGLRDERRFNTVSGSGSVFARPAEGWFTALTLSRTERAPSDVEVFSFGPHLATRAFEIGDLALDTETALSAEGTARWTSDRFTWEASVYYADYDGFIELFPTGGVEDGLDVFEYRQEDARLYGLETRATAALFSAGGFDVGAEATADFVRGELKDSGDLPRIPPMSGTIGLNADNGRLRLGTDVRLVGEQDRVADFETETDGYALWNAQASWRPLADRDLTLTAGVRNITDEEARTHTSFLKDYIPLPGRNYRLSVSTRF